MSQDTEKTKEPAPECVPGTSEGPEVDMPCAEGGETKAAAVDTQDPVLKELSMLKTENTALKAEVEGLKDARLRALAEFDNFKRRTARDSIRTIENANESLIKELIPVLENFERALNPEHKEKDIDAFYKGIDLIYNLFFEKLKKAGVVEFNPLGDEFNTEKHEAVMQIASSDYPEHKIAQVFQKGYQLNNKVIQYAKVAVSKGNA